MADDNQPCAHPEMCSEQGDFSSRVKTQKLALEPPPPSDLLPRPSGQTESAIEEKKNE